MSDEENPFARWSRRKRRVAEEEAALPVPPEPEPVVEIAEPGTPEEEAELLRRLELPAPESLKQGDDFTVFMKADVPAFLRKRALRVLWRSNPVLANLDGLNDYDADFRSPELTQKVLATGYKIGRGFLREEHVSEIMQDNDKKLHNGDRNDGDIEEDPGKIEAEADAPAIEPIAELSDEDTDDDLSFHPKRMRFTT